MRATRSATLSSTLRGRLLISVLAVGFAASACGSDAQPLTASTPSTSVPVTVADEAIPVEPDGGIGDTAFGGVPFFGSNDDQCESTVLLNESDDQAKVQVGAECFLAELGVGTPVVWDLNQPTVEGDPIFTRHIFDGENVWLLRDDRADSYGSGNVQAQRCEGAEANDWGITGVTCENADYPSFSGFPEAE